MACIAEQIKVIEESPKIMFWTMLSTIGGSMGLYVGVSIITLMEVIELCSTTVGVYSEKYLTDKIKD